MGTQAVINNLKTQQDEFLKIEKSKLLREDLGAESRKNVFEPLLTEIEYKLNFAITYSDTVTDTHINKVISYFTNIISELNQHIKRSSSDYITQSNTVVNSITTHLNSIREEWPHFFTSAIEKRGFLDDEGLQQAYQKTIATIKSESQEALEKVKKEAERTIESAKKLAEEIENKARRTAAKISVEEAQKQFSNAQKGLRIHIGIWSSISVIIILIFTFIAYQYLFKIQLPDKWTWQFIYFTSIRLAILTFIGSLLTYSLRTLRAYLHMNQMNLHRQKVANSIEAFVVSAITPEVRDQLLLHLSETVIAFGNSGLLPDNNDTIGSQKLPFENIANLLNAGKK